MTATVPLSRPRKSRIGWLVFGGTTLGPIDQSLKTRSLSEEFLGSGQGIVRAKVAYERRLGDGCWLSPMAPAERPVRVRNGPTGVVLVGSAVPPDCGHLPAWLSGLIGATSGLVHPQHRYSITSSARCCRNQGTSRPNALAVLRLIASSNVVGCSTGRSAGFAPLRILST
jgi:hypothetical protein